MPRRPRNFFSKVTKVVFPKLRLQDAANPLQYLGQTVLAQKEFDEPFEEIKMKDIRGNVAHPKHFQINGTHLVSMFSFFMQMEEGKLPTQDEEDEFNLATDIKRIKRTDGTEKKG